MSGIIKSFDIIVVMATFLLFSIIVHSILDFTLGVQLSAVLLGLVLYFRYKDILSLSHENMIVAFIFITCTMIFFSINGDKK